MQLRNKRHVGVALAADTAEELVAAPSGAVEVLATPPAAVPTKRRRRSPSSNSAAADKPKKAPEDIGITHLLLGAGSALPLAAEAASPAPAPATVGRLKDEAALQLAAAHLVAADPALAPLIEQHGLPPRLLEKEGSCFATLAKSICFQQLATAAAAAIYGRALKCCGCAEVLTPAAMLAAPVAGLRTAGLSERKVSYLRDLADHFVRGHLSDERIYAWDAPTLHRELTQARGQQARWRQARCPDVLPVGDLGVRRGMAAHYGLRELPTPADMQRLTQAWAPYRSVGSYYMWRVEVPSSRKGKAAKRSAKAAAQGESSDE
eukprot:scaffold20.g7764.t1